MRSMSYPVRLGLNGGVNISHSSVQSPVEPPGGLDARFCEVMDAAPVLIWVSGQDKRCIWFNQPWLTFTGRSMAQEVGNGWTDGVHQGDIDRCVKVYTSHFDARSGFRMHYRLRRHDGEYRWIDDTGVPRYAHDGTFLGYIGSCVDVHEHRRTQVELRHRLQEISELNRQAEVATLAASIAHEINQPLAAIISNGDAGLLGLENKSLDLDELREILTSIVDEAHRTSKIIDSIRSVFKKGHQVRELLDLNALIRDVLLLVDADLHNHNITVQTGLSDALPQVSADPIQLQQVVLNLIKNAIEAMSAAKGSRVLRLETELGGSANVLITVRDTGAGIDARNIEHIFDRFFTTKSKGMGMGLSICRSIIEALGGRLWTESRPHQGSVFRISLPIAAS
jgi:PAS domain S-box-containing protein